MPPFTRFPSGSLSTPLRASLESFNCSVSVIAKSVGKNPVISISSSSFFKFCSPTFSTVTTAWKGKPTPSPKSVTSLGGVLGRKLNFIPSLPPKKDSSVLSSPEVQAETATLIAIKRNI